MEKEGGFHVTKAVLRKYEGDINACKTPEERQAFLENSVPYEVRELKDNCLLNTGINEMWKLVKGEVSGADHIYDNTHAQIGVGDSSTAANATQTDLQAASNKTYKAMESGYPEAISAQKIVLKSAFGSSDANYAWEEWVVKQSTSAVCLNRKAESLGTKSGGTWTLEVEITLS